MRLLITGTSGLLGLNLALEARNSHQVVGVDRCQLKSAPFELVCADLLEQGAVDRVLDTARPNWLIHCAALANLEACEVDAGLAQRLNAVLPGELAAACKVRGVKLVQISTDAVFDGTKNGLYTEEDGPHALNVYAETKLQGEQAVLAANPDAIVARVNFYGFSLNGKRSLAEFFINNLSAGQSVKGFTDLNFNPTFVGNLTNLLLRMLEKDLRGVYHTVTADVMSKYTFGVTLARRFGWDETLIVPESVDRSELTARRGNHLGLSVQKLISALGEPFPDFSTGLDQFHSQFQQGYPQKIRNYQ
jgi:dTDP-4-dehydrorhamnose reductase